MKTESIAYNPRSPECARFRRGDTVTHAGTQERGRVVGYCGQFALVQFPGACRQMQESDLELHRRAEITDSFIPLTQRYCGERAETEVQP